MFKVFKYLILIHDFKQMESYEMIVMEFIFWMQDQHFKQLEKVIKMINQVENKIITQKITVKDLIKVIQLKIQNCYFKKLMEKQELFQMENQQTLKCLILKLMKFHYFLQMKFIQLNKMIMLMINKKKVKMNLLKLLKLMMKENVIKKQNQEQMNQEEKIMRKEQKMPKMMKSLIQVMKAVVLELIMILVNFFTFLNLRMKCLPLVPNLLS